jgi:hypothetical protein
MSILNSFVNDIFERVAGEASKLASYNKKSVKGYGRLEAGYITRSSRPGDDRS